MRGSGFSWPILKVQNNSRASILPVNKDQFKSSVAGISDLMFLIGLDIFNLFHRN